MPQAKNRMTGFVFRSVGKGKAPEMTLDGSIQTWKRAEILNHRESVNLRMHQQFLVRQAHVTAERQKRTAARIQRSLDVLQAYNNLIRNEYRIEKFDTLKWGYRTPDPDREPERFQRFVYETKIYHSGFSVQTLQREVNKRLEEMRIDRIQELARTRRIERLKRHCKVELLDRKKSLTTILKEARRDGTGGMAYLKLPPIVKQGGGAVKRHRIWESGDEFDDDDNDDDDDDVVVDSGGGCDSDVTDVQYER